MLSNHSLAGKNVAVALVAWNHESLIREEQGLLSWESNHSSSRFRTLMGGQAVLYCL